ncbi:MAG: lysozyme [Alphaproteobacteria bacterium]|nr:lysozyme [Alphaproteobacteria bacterium]
MTKLRPSRRASAAIAAVMAVVISIGGVLYAPKPGTSTQYPAVVVLAAEAIIKDWEGEYTTAYWDALGGVWTVCFGETKNVRKGDHYTPDQCLEMLYKRLATEYYPPIKACVIGFDSGPLSWQSSSLSLSYNVGVSGYCGSTAARRARAGDYLGSCEAMTWWNQAGGNVVRGLVHRREMGDAERIGEGELCVTGLK